MENKRSSFVLFGFPYGETRFNVEKVTAIRTMYNGLESKRENALSVVQRDGKEEVRQNRTEFIVFNHDMPKNSNEFFEMYRDANSWEYRSKKHMVHF